MNRYYLPFKSAREYQDRGMAKWMGFFLSEHTTALSQFESKQPLDLNYLSEDTKCLLLTQAYLNRLTLQLTQENQPTPLIGIVKEVTSHTIHFQSDDKLHTIPFQHIQYISLVEDSYD